MTAGESLQCQLIFNNDLYSLKSTLVASAFNVTSCTHVNVCVYHFEIERFTRIVVIVIVTLVCKVGKPVKKIAVDLLSTLESSLC